MPRSARPLALVLAAGLLLPAAHLEGQAAAGRRPRAPRAAGTAGADAERIRRDVLHLADDRLAGRFTGEPGNDSAAAYVARRFAALRLTPVVADESEACARRRVTMRAGREQPPCVTFQQKFVARSAALAHAGRGGELATQNVVAAIPGTDPALRGQVVVLGAHYDHLGKDKTFARDQAAGDAIRNGADDNASGTAAVMELARLFAARPAKRTVLVVAFGGEELGLLGSQWFVDHSPVPVDSIAAMLNFDMVGRLKEDRLLVYGTATATELPAILDSANAAGPKLQVKGIGDGFGPSDHSSFYAKNLPVLHFFTDLHDDYHAATDDPATLNYAGAARVTDLAHAVARTIADRPARLTFQRAATTQRMAGAQSSQGPRPYLGSVPDMSSDGVQGLKLQGVTPGSPADKAGLRAGDVVVDMEGAPVTDLYSYTDALYARKPGDVIKVTVLRAAAAGGPPERVTVSVTLTQRGQ